MLPQAHLTPHSILFFTAILSTIEFFTSSAVLWPFGSIVLAVLNVITVCLLINTAWFVDPAMDELIEKRKQGHTQVPYVPGSGHVIVNGRCRICLIDAPKGTKHCRVCNVCIQNFDHHCVWLNRCVGSKNYKHFLILISCVLINSLVTWVYHLALLAMWFSKSENLAPIVVKDDRQFIQLPLLEVILYAWIGATLLLVCVGLFTFLPVTNLCFFHMRLIQKGQTTYMVIMEDRGRGKQKATVTGISQQSNLSEVRIIGSRGAVTPSSARSVRDVPPPVFPRVMETEPPD